MPLIPMNPLLAPGFNRQVGGEKASRLGGTELLGLVFFALKVKMLSPVWLRLFLQPRSELRAGVPGWGSEPEDAAALPAADQALGG